MMRAIHTLDLGVPNPAGLAYSPRSEVFYVVNASRPGLQQDAGTIVMMSPFAAQVGSLRVAGAIADPINMTCDSRTGQLILLGQDRQDRDDRDDRDDVTLKRERGARQRPPVVSLNGASFGLERPEGMSMDPATGSLFVLDSASSRVLRLAPERRFARSRAPFRLDGRRSWIDLLPLGESRFRGVAFNPANGHLYVLSPESHKLYEITKEGEPVSSYDLSGVDLVSPQALVFAPSGDPTDDPSVMNLFIADTGPQGPSGHGHIFEISLVPLPVSAAASIFTAALVRTIDTSRFSPPSPDPMGITYNPVTNTLVESDSEVEEMRIYAGANVYEMSLSGTLLKTYRTNPSNEPAGITINTSNGHWIFSDDDINTIFDVDLGPDRLFRTADDRMTSFSTDALGDHDPEDVVYDPLRNHLFLADGVGAEIWDVSPGANGRFDGVPPSGDDTVTHFDTLALGLVCPEGIGFNKDSGTLYLSSRGARFIQETTTGGLLLRTINTPTVPDSRPSGLVYAPSSTDPTVMHLYIADRGVDNCTIPSENDGLIFEITLPSSTAPVNGAPSVSAGPDLAITLPALATLNGSATDDGLPAPPALTVAWSLVSGPGTVAFGNAGSAATSASFSAPGVYLLRLTASDGALGASDDVVVTVASAAGGTGRIDARVSASADDAEESATGAVSLTSSDLELTFDGSTQKVGLRFNGIAIPPGAAITAAYIQFKTDETQPDATALVIQGQNIGNAPAFASTASNISSRARTAASVPWPSVPVWTTVGEAGPNQRSPDIAPVIRAIVGRGDWVSGNALVIILTGTGHRTAVAFNGIPAGAPMLHVEFGAAGLVNQPPSVIAGSSQTITLPASANLTGSVLDDGLPAPAALTTTWSQASGPGPVTFGNSAALATTATFPTSGVYVLRLSASDGVLSASATVTLTVNPAPAGAQTADIRVAASADDAEERSSATALTSTDLELTFDGEIQKIGLRFANVPIPPGATITAAYIQFQIDEAQSEVTALTLQGQYAGDAAAFTTAAGDISARARTLASVAWSPVSWASVGLAGPDQQTPDIAVVIQEIVNHPSWATGHALALIVTGTGHRTAVAWDGIPAGAPLLHVAYR